MGRPARVAMLCLTLAALACSTPPPPPFKPVADIKLLMSAVLEPAADAYWDAVGAIIDEKGTQEFEPQTLEEWEAVRNSAYVVAESGNLLMMGSRARDGGDWMRFSQALIDVGQKAARAAESRSAQAVFDAGADVYDACTACHAVYAVELQRPGGR